MQYVLIGLCTNKPIVVVHIQDKILVSTLQNCVQQVAQFVGLKTVLFKKVIHVVTKAF